LEGDRAVALEADRLRYRESEVRRALEQQPTATTERQPELALLGQFLGVPPDRAELLRALMYSILVEIVEITLFCVAGLLSIKSKSAGREDLDQAPIGSETEKLANATRVHQARGEPAAGAGARQAGGRARLERTAAVGRGVNNGPASRRSTARQAGSCGARPREQQPSSRASLVGPADERQRVAAAFVAQLPTSPSARATGSALFAEYDRVRAINGWPPVPPNVFGAFLKPAVEAVGGQKRKSNQQIYFGIGVPPV